MTVICSIVIVALGGGRSVAHRVCVAPPPKPVSSGCIGVQARYGAPGGIICEKKGR